MTDSVHLAVAETKSVQASTLDKYAPLTEEQRRRWREDGVFPVERWGAAPGSTPLVCPLPDRALLRNLAESIPAHIQSSGWYATGQRYEARTVHSVYGDNFRGMGRQAIASVISVGSYSGPLADYIAAACPRTMLALLDRISELEAVAGKLLEALTMVRDADEDCIRDHLTRMPPTARAIIDSAIAKALGATS